MPVLKRTGIHHIVNPVEYLVPLAFVLLDGNSLFLGQFAPAGHHRLLAVDPRRDEGGQPARNFLALFAQGMERPDGTLGGTADLATQVPAAETLVFAAVHVPHLVDYIFIMLHLMRHVARVPIFARVVKPEVKLHAVLAGQAQEQIEQVDRRHVTPFFEQVGRRVGDELAVARANPDHRVDADRLHMAEICVPLLLAPVLVRDVVRNFVEERTRDAQPFPLWDDQPAVPRSGCGQSIVHPFCTQLRSCLDQSGDGDSRSRRHSYFLKKIPSTRSFHIRRDFIVCIK